MVRRRRLSVLAVLALLVALVNMRGATALPPSNPSKLDGSLRGIVQQGVGDTLYGDVVSGHVPGTVYYLAELRSIDAVSLSALRGAGATVRHRYDLIGWVALSSPSASVARVAALPQVTRLVADRVLQVVSTTAVAQEAPPAFGDQTMRGTSDIGADVAWSAGTTGDGVTVGVVDSGIDSTHVDLAGKVDTFVNCMGVVPSLLVGVNDVGSCVPAPGHDDNGHGTHVSGIAAGSGAGDPALPGVAPDARLAGAKVCNAAGSCLNSSVMAGIQTLATPVAEGGGGANVINISLGGGPVYAAGLFTAEQATDADPEAQLINTLADTYNVVFAISAGNSGPTLQSVGTPSTASQAMSVGAAVTDWDLDHARADTMHGQNGNVRPEAAAAGVSGIATFSSRGPSGDRQIKPDLTAPGSYYIAAESTAGEIPVADILFDNKYSTNKQYMVVSGTSMSAPAAAGASALVIDGYREAVGADPTYYVVKAALANTAHGSAFEGPVTGLTSTIRTNRLGDTPEALFPRRNDAEAGVTGVGAGRLYVPDAILASTAGVLVYTPEDRDADGRLTTAAFQPGWAMDDVAPGESSSQEFVLRGGPALASGGPVTFAVESGPEAIGVRAAPASWFTLPDAVTAAPGTSTFDATVSVPADAAPGQYAATLVATADLGGGVTQRVRIPVQFFVPMPVDGEISGPIWAADTTDYSIVGFQNPLGGINTDWAMVPLRVPASGVSSLTLHVWDAAGVASMDVFVFDSSGVEIYSSIDDLAHMTPAGAGLFPTTEESPEEVTIGVVPPDQELAFAETHAGDVVWVVLSNTKPSAPAVFDTYRLRVTPTP